MRQQKCPPTEVIEDVFKSLLRARQAEFAALAGYQDADAWDTAAAEPGVEIDFKRELSGPEFERAWKRWRQQWIERVQLLPHQEHIRKTEAGSS